MGTINGTVITTAPVGTDDFPPPSVVPLACGGWDGRVTPADWYYAIRQGWTSGACQLTEEQRAKGLSPIVAGSSLQAVEEAIQEQKRIEYGWGLSP